jgi:two-component system repressor protein LuxO
MPSPVPSPAAEPAVPLDPAPLALDPAPLVFEKLAVVERRYIMAALDHTGQDIPRAAAMLGINPSTIYRKLQAWKAEDERGLA